MPRHSRAAFTLVELLVVVVIIGMLVSLLLPAVQAARESARQAKCTNNQKELGAAVIQYETSKGHFPGYVNRFGKSVPLSWVAVIFADLGRADLWRDVRLWDDPKKVQVTSIGQLVCPSDQDWAETPGRLSYVANCGRVDLRPPRVKVPPEWRADWPYNGVFHNHYDDGRLPVMPNEVPVSNQVSMSAADIHDGTQQTLMLSEHVNPADAPRPYLWINVTEWEVGFMWGAAANETWLNQLRFTWADPASPQPADHDTGPGNPSSYHPNGVIVTFCDQHTQFLRNDIHYAVFQHLMTPDSAKARSALPTAQQECNLTGVLSEDDY